ncbi:MAG TPA: Do family serine endopeptidase [Xanthobacteraceae bacterium]|nr:Do family serine endopeptidase [Xanthobacteraceae bacterium]
MSGDSDFRALPRRSPAKLRVILLGTAVGLAAAGLVAVPAVFGPTVFPTPAVGAAHAAPEQVQGPPGFAALVAKVKPAVVSVRVRISESTSEPIPRNSPFYFFFHGQGQQQQQQQQDEIITGEGSGFFISSDGYVVTNNHVVDDAKTVQVTTTDGDIYTAKVVGTDPRSDLALLKVNANKQFSYVNFAEHTPQVGDWVVAVGNPFGLGGTVTAGIVSARSRDIGNNSYDDYLQIDAPINKGNSGGPAFDMEGNVIGVNTAIFSPSGGSVGIGFDVPAGTAKTVITQLKDKGYVTRGWIGVQVQPVTAEIAESLGLKQAEGALVDEPEPNSPAAQVGIKAGDVITQVNGRPIKDARALAQMIAIEAPGSKVEITILRDGRTSTLDTTLGTMPKEQEEANAQPQPQQPTAEPNLGLNLAPAHEVEGSGNNGVVVLAVDPSGPGAQSGVQTGDVILDAGGKTVQTPADVRQAIDQTRSQGKHSILMRLKSSDGTRFVALPIGQG